MCHVNTFLRSEEFDSWLTGLKDNVGRAWIIQRIRSAVRDVARARGMAQLAKDSGLGRESLYKALTPGAKPRYDTMLKLLHALGVKLSASPMHL